LCECDPEEGEVTYEVRDAQSHTACAIASHFCGKEAVVGETICGTRYDVSDTDQCEFARVCGTPVPSNPGLRVPLRESTWVGCGRSGSDSDAPFACECSVDTRTMNYEMSAETAVGACERLLDFCSASTPVFEEPTTCVEDERVGDSGSCSLYQTCSTPKSLTDDIDVVLVEPRFSNCEPSEEGGSICYCSGRHSSFRFELEGEVSSERCTSSILNCDKDVTIETSGSATCEPTSRSTASDSCEADLDCWQSALVDGRPIRGIGRLLTYCRRESPGQPWWCSCASNQDSARFELGQPELTPWNACEASSEQCLDVMPVFIGPYGEFKPAPDPLSDAP
jgi:hypothetical protein